MFKCGFVGIIGRPNVGKSTMLNIIVGEKIAAVTAKPQTTRNKITGIYNTDDSQVIFVDTPGIHQAFTALNRSIVNNAIDAVKGVEVVALLFEAPSGITKHDIDIISELKLRPSIPIVAIINKIDRVDKLKLLPMIDTLDKLFLFRAIIPVSALCGSGMSIAITEITKLLPEGEPCFPKDLFTDKTERFIVEEIIREQIILNTEKEIPYSCAITIDSFTENEIKNLIVIKATINVNKKTQKAIVVGKDGAMVKKIGTASRKAIEAFFATKVFLELFVRVQEGWTQDPRMLREFGIAE